MLYTLLNNDVNYATPAVIGRCPWSIRVQTQGRGVLPYMGNIGMCRFEGYGFPSSLVWDRVYKSESLGLE